MKVAGCPLCEGAGGHLVFQAEKFRLIRAQEAGFPAFWRLVWQEHVAEFSDLDEADRILCMNALACVEQVVRRELQPTKINLAALGNMVPHLHWHLIARYEWDSHFPAPVWAQALRSLQDDRLAKLEARLPDVDAAIQQALPAALGNRTAS